MKNDYITFRNLVISRNVKDHVFSFRAREKSILSQHSEKVFLPEQNLNLIHIAAFADALEIFIYLHEDCHLPINLPSIENYTPLHYACFGGSLEVASYILQRSPEQATILPNVPHHLLYLATFSGSSDILSLLLRCHADINSIENRRESPIILSLEKRFVPCLKLLLQEGSRLNYATRGYSAIMRALELNMEDAVPLLLEYGEDPTVFAENGNCALSIAAFQQYPNTVRLLCDKIPNIEPDPWGQFYDSSPVHWGCKSYTPEIMEILLEKGINVNQLDKKGYCGPHYLIDFGNDDDNVKILDMLLKHGFNVNLTNPIENNMSLLEDVITRSISRHFKIIQWLIENGADLLKRVGTNGPTLATLLLEMPDLPLHLRDLVNSFV